MDGKYLIVREGDLEFFYKVMPFNGVRAAFLIDVTGKSARHFNRAVKYILKHNRKEFDVILYVGNLYFRNSGLIKVPRRFAPKQFNFIIRFFDTSYNNEMVRDLRSWVQIPEFETLDKTSSFHVYALRLRHADEARRDAVIQRIFDQEVSVNVHFIPLPMLTCYKNLGYDSHHYPVTYDNYSREISLPVYYDLTDEQVETVIKAVKKATEE